MAWTAVLTWATGRNVSAADMNTYVSNNDAYMKTYVDLISPAKTANFVFAGPTSGGDAVMAARALVAADLPVSDAWTPVMGDGTNNFTLSTANGRYIKLGNVVLFWAHCVWSSIGSAGAGGLQITLPFTTNATAGRRYSFPLGNVNGMDNGGGKQIVVSAGNNESFLSFYLVNDNASYSGIAANAQSATGFVQVSGSYEV